jgi:DNA-directed RNA polymerase specialized sigma24 family protein
MDWTDPDLRLNQITTLWSLVRLAHEDPGEDAHAARRALLERYLKAINRYLTAAVRDPDAADELCQEFAFRFLHGDLRGADRARGRFRDFVKGVLFHLAADFHTRKRKQPGSLPPDHPEPAVECSLAAEREEEFRTIWRDELLARSWAALLAYEKAHGQPFYTVLRFRADNPEVPSHQMAERLSGPLGKPLTAAGVRKTLERAREKFGDLLLEEIAQGLDPPTRERLVEELIDLELLEHCKPALERRGPAG